MECFLLFFNLLKTFVMPYWITSNLLLLVFSAKPFKIDQNKNQNRLIDKVQDLGKKHNEKRKMLTFSISCNAYVFMKLCFC